MPKVTRPNGATPAAPTAPAAAKSAVNEAPAAAPTARPYAPKTGPVTVKNTTAMEAPVAAKKPTTAAPISAASTQAPAATVAVAFDKLDAPGGPAKARLLSDGLDAWNARMDIVEHANTSIDASYFIMEKDPYGYAFLGGLLKKQLEGVQVRVSTDPLVYQYVNGLSDGPVRFHYPGSSVAQDFGAAAPRAAVAS